MLAENNQTIDKAVSSVWQMTEDERIRDRMQRREDGERLWKMLVKDAETARQQTEEARRQTAEARQQTAAEKARADEADKRADQAEQTIEEQNKLIRELRDKLAAYENN